MAAGTGATAAGRCWSSATAAFIFWIAGIVSSALTLLIVCANAGPSAARTLCLTIGATFWNPNTPFGSASITYLPVVSCGSVVNASNTCTWPESIAL